MQEGLDMKKRSLNKTSDDLIENFPADEWRLCNFFLFMNDKMFEDL